MRILGPLSLQKAVLRPTDTPSLGSHLLILPEVWLGGHRPGINSLWSGVRW